MDVSLIKKAFSKNRVTLGSWIQLGHPGIAEILANAGFEWIVADCEHTDIDVAGFTELARAMHGRGAIPLVRVRENDTLTIRQMLDAGAKGVIVPLINNAEEAQKAVNAAKYPPDGIRGFAFSRANDYGANFSEYVSKANDDMIVLVMIESKEAVQNIDSILAVEGIDGVFMGPYDLSGSYGVVGETSHPLLLSAFKTIVKAAEKAGKIAGIHAVIPTEETIIRAINDGFKFIALGMDDVYLDTGSRAALKTAKDALAKYKEGK